MYPCDRSTLVYIYIYTRTTARAFARAQVPNAFAPQGSHVAQHGFCDEHQIKRIPVKSLPKEDYEHWHKISGFLCNTSPFIYSAA